ncbi:hypothetical protein MSAN_01814200 [Mycena sanguinolenta]|uniref:DUF6534 domain-containing protein n=1 Tax=Mycena sanguinolenta TaxID=230812 RepID=A0A8H6XRM4_9AGAR|nr:hypothetical protein MSAN_01814200 [Mycena sanguinolenta]
MATFNPNPTLGAVQIGVLISYILFGVATTQAYLYFTRYPDDPRGVRALTAFVWACDLARTICLGAVLYTYTITDFTHPERLDGPPALSLCLHTFFSVLTAACVQGFFAFRIYVFTKKVYIPLLIWCMAFLPLLGGIVLFALTLRVPSITVYVANWEWLVTTNWSLSVATDLVITTTLVIVLRRQRSRAHNKTAVVVDKLIVWTIETGLLTSVSSILTLAFFVSMKTNYIWLTFYTVSTGLFPNSLLASLNSRASLRAIQPPGLKVLASTGSPSSDGVHIKTESHVMYDIQDETTFKYPETT